MHEPEPHPFRATRREPAINLPAVIIVLALIIIGVHAIRTYILTPDQNFQTILTFSFIPAYFTLSAEQLPYPLARYWSFVSYAFLHADWMHVMVNLLWTIAFGSAVARRFGATRFLLMSMFAAIAGAVAHFVMHPGDITPVIGASACVAAYMGAASRFIMGPSGLGAGQMGGGYHPPALSLIQALSNRSVLIFVGVWMALNFVFGTGMLAVAGEDAQIAWEAHVGGFLFGLFAFSLFDPRR